MEDNRADLNAAGQVELSISKVDSLAVLPTVATEILVNASASGSTSLLAEIVDADPALSFNVLALARAQGRRLSDCGFSVRRLCEELPEQSLRETLLKARVLNAVQAQTPPQLHRAGLTTCSIGAACCARLIAEAEGGINPELAYTAGLLHSLGLFALADTMPKSFVRIVEEASSRKVALNMVEQQHLGTDHAVLGKRLAQKLGLPPAIIIGIWLSHTESSLISRALPQARVAQMVRLACVVTRDCGIGQSPDFGGGGAAQELAAQFSISAEQLRNIRAALPSLVTEKTALLGLDKAVEPERISDVLRAAATRLALSNGGLSQENQHLRTAAMQYDFISGLLSNASRPMSPVEVAGIFASLWQRTYQTGKVCVVLANDSTGAAEAVTAENQSQIEYLPVDSGSLKSGLARFAGGFDVLKVDENVAGLLERLDADFEFGCVRVLPLLSSGQVIGLLIFEFRYPVPEEQLKERFEPAAKAGAAILNMITHSRGNEQLAERLVAGLGSLPLSNVSKPAGGDDMAALTELAAGAAHEMNNPLSVISGRAQFLSRTELDPERKRTLAVIQKNADHLSGMIDDLMSYAAPAPPKPATMRIAQLIDEAVQLAALKTGVQNPDIGVEISDDSLTVFVDSPQVASAIANIIANAVESYEQGGGPVKVSATAKDEDKVELNVVDRGCGMDSETLAKATHPFFSAKPAGRRRGMGLAHARRLIELNGGSVRIERAAGAGTSVTISLPASRG